MSLDTSHALATLIVAAAFVLVFYGESWLQPKLGPEATRRIVSFSVGSAVAYVFIHLLPELATATSAFVELDTARDLPFPQFRIYGAALLGFMLFYGLENMARWPRLTRAEAGGDRDEREERIHLRILTISYALYVFVVCYVMVHELRSGGGELALFAVAMALHFLGFAYGLRHDDAALYGRWGRHVLAAAAIAGWAIAVLLPLPDAFTFTLLGFVAGVLIMDTVTSELAGQAEGRFGAFLAGGLAYTALLLFAAH